MSLIATVTADTTFGEFDRRLAQSRLKVLSLAWQASDQTYSVRVGSCLKHIYFGTGNTIHSAITSALDEYVIHMANKYSRERIET